MLSLPNGARSAPATLPLVVVFFNATGAVVYTTW